MQDVPPSSEDQVSEHLPWEHLTIPPSRDRRFLIYGVAGGPVVVILLVVVLRQVNSPSPAELAPVIPVTVTSAEATSTDAATQDTASSVTSPPSTVPLAGPEAPLQISEADLRAVEPGNVEREVAARAEWFVLEFFTLDPSDPWQGRVEAASGLELPNDLVPNASDDLAVSYVEWTRAASIQQIGEYLFEAFVLIRRLVASDGVTFRRLPVEQVAVHFETFPDGRIRAASLPRFTIPDDSQPAPLVDAGLSWVTDAAGIVWPHSPQPLVGALGSG